MYIREYVYIRGYVDLINGTSTIRRRAYAGTRERKEEKKIY